MSTSAIVTSYLESLTATIALLAQPEVAQAWARPSALEGMTVGALATHLGRAITLVPEYLERTPTSPVLTGPERLAHAQWATTSADSPANISIRDRAREHAELGPQALVESVRQAAAELPCLLAAQPEDRLVEVPDGVCLTLDDYITSRLLEITVHCDDLAVSVGLPTPLPPVQARRAVMELLTDVAIARHGWPAVLATLSRPERAPDTITALGPITD